MLKEKLSCSRTAMRCQSQIVSRFNEEPPPPYPQPTVMSTPISILWALLSIVVAGTCSFSFMQPYWFIDFKKWTSFGMYSFCYREVKHLKLEQVCRIYGGHFDFSFLPSNAWQASCVLYGGGCLFLCLAAMFAVMSLCVPSSCDKKLALVAGYVQLLAVLIMIAGLIVYPFGLDSRLLKYYCGQTGMFNSGNCDFGWSYMLGIVGTALAIFCPFLSQYTDTKVNKRRKNNSNKMFMFDGQEVYL